MKQRCYDGLVLDTIRHDSIFELRLNRPPANALDPGLIAALRRALAAAPGEGAEALVLSGAPGMFSAGLDLPALLPLGRDEIRATWRDFYALMKAIARSPVPIAAAIGGHSPAGGAVLALFCDYRVMADGDFKIGLNEVQVGLPLPPVIQDALARLVGPHQADRLGMAGLMVDPREALRVGLVDEVVPMAQVEEIALHWCHVLLALPRRAMLETRERGRRSLVALFDRDDEAREIEGLVERWFSEETRGAMRSLLERLAAKKRG